MVNKSAIIPGFSKFIDENVLAHYPATSMKRILMAGAVSLYLKQGEGLVDSLISNPLITNLGIVKQDGFINIDPIRDTLKNEISKAGYMRVTIPMVGDVDFTPEDADALYKFIVEANTQVNANNTPVQTTMPNGGVY
jgi:hypothetical protein